MEVARRAKAEIVSMDAFQIYRGMDIGTAKAKKKDQEEIPHHLLDLVEPEDPFSSADYKREGEKTLTDLQRRKKNAIWVGGTGLYHRVMTEGLSAAPPTERETADEIETMSTPEMADEIRRVDPVWAQGADLRNRRRMVRALAVWRQSGRTLSDWQKNETKAGPLSRSETYVLFPKIKELAPSILGRVTQMLEEGWVEEVRGLMKKKGWQGSPGSRAIGYSEVALLIEGKMGRQETCEKIVTATRAYAKRQLTWFRGLSNFQPIEIDPQLPPSRKAVETLVTALSP
jgi:tRNA dimethylallyltransferase